MSKARGRDQIIPGSLIRSLFHITNPGEAVVTKVTVAGPGLKMQYSGGDAGTGDVEIRLVRTDQIFKQFLLNGGSSAMNISGAPTEFAYSADASVDTFLKEVVLELQDGSVTFEKFGDLTALTTGFDLQINQGGVTKTLIDKAKTTYQMIRDLGAGSFDLMEKSTSTNGDSILIRIQLYDAKLAAASADKIFATVRDNLTGLTRFNAYVIAGRES